MKFSLRLDYLFEHDKLEDQIRFAAESGTDAIETGDMTNYDCVKALDLSEKYNVPYIAIGFYDIMNCRVGDKWENIKDSFERTIECAKQLKVKTLLTLGPDVVDRGESARKMFVENIKPAVELCEDNDIKMLLEPHVTKYPNPFGDFSNYFINTSEIALNLINRIGSPKVKMLFDCYHIQTMEGDLLMKIKQHLQKIAHFHIAGAPDRDEPWFGEINYPNVLKQINSMGYDDYYGLEYYPKDNSPANVSKVLEYLRGN